MIGNTPKPPRNEARHALRRAAAACALLIAQAAGAHAQLKQSVPAANAELDRPPTQVTLHFNEALEQKFSSIQLEDAGGHDAAGQGAVVDPDDASTIRLSLPVLGKGRYRVRWAAMSRDGHRTKGDFSFLVK